MFDVWWDWHSTPLVRKGEQIERIYLYIAYRLKTLYTLVTLLNSIRLRCQADTFVGAPHVVCRNLNMSSPTPSWKGRPPSQTDLLHLAGTCYPTGADTSASQCAVPVLQCIELAHQSRFNYLFYSAAGELRSQWSSGQRAHTGPLTSVRVNFSQLFARLLVLHYSGADPGVSRVSGHPPFWLGCPFCKLHCQ